MSNPKVFDRNGQEIHIGDRVKIIGVEVADFLKTWCGDFFSESVLADIKDDFGIVVDDDFLQVVNENGDTLYDLSINDSEPDPMIEIVSDMENQHGK